MLANVMALVAGVGLGIFYAVFPERAAKRWGGIKLGELSPESRPAALWTYRIFGIVIALACALFLLKMLTA